MSTLSQYDFRATNAWPDFIQRYQISPEQQQQFQEYGKLLVQENEKYNITAIEDAEYIVADHFFDSLALLKLYDVSCVQRVVDVGSGGGFPGVPLAIMLPHVQFHLVEVNLKKVHFLKLVAQTLGLTNITVHTDDWRNFLRHFDQAVDLFVARASLQVDELLRVFKPSLKYQKSTLVYWASKNWVPNSAQKEYVNKCLSYTVGEKQRQLYFFTLPA